MIGNRLHLMKVLHYRIGLKTIPKTSTFCKLALDKKLSLTSDTRIGITHIVYLLFMLPLRMPTNHMSSVLLFLPFGMGRPRTPAPSKIALCEKTQQLKAMISTYYPPTCLPACLPAHHCYKVRT